MSEIITMLDTATIAGLVLLTWGTLFALLMRAMRNAPLIEDETFGPEVYLGPPEARQFPPSLN